MNWTKIQKIVAATRNPNKLRELRRLLGGLGIDVVLLDSFDGLTEVEETGATFEGNATLKALGYAAQTGLPCMADDSGLEVAALNGAPGVFSSRYAGPGADDKVLCRKLLSEMQHVPEGGRRARFRCAVALAADGKVILKAQGDARGRIVREMRGQNGFGYDPLFMPESFDKTFAEMEPREKDSISHRAKALAVFKAKLKKLLHSKDRV